MFKKTTSVILIVLAFVAVGVFSATLSSKQLQTPQAKEILSKETNMFISPLTAMPLIISLGLIMIASAVAGTGVAKILTSLNKKK